MIMKAALNLARRGGVASRQGDLPRVRRNCFERGERARARAHPSSPRNLDVGKGSVYALSWNVGRKGGLLPGCTIRPLRRPT